jgi:hypothetical protein
MTQPSGAYSGAGDQAAVVEWKMNRLNAKGKPIYLRKYFHLPAISSADHDALDSTYVTTLNTFATQVMTFHGGIRTGPRDKLPAIPADAAVAHEVIPWVTTRTLKRRGKRPRTGN